MIIKEMSFQIKKIKETSEDWLLYPKGEKEPMHLPKKRVYGKLPPVWKFPWQYHTLNIKTVVNYAVYAEMDGLILFNLSEKNYPEHVKQKIACLRKIEEEEAKRLEEYRILLKQQILEYLPKVPHVAELEDEISKLPICWRAYLKMLLPMQYQDVTSRQRLTLMYWLITICNRLYMRHVDTKAMLSSTFASVDFSVKCYSLALLNDAIVEEIDKDPQNRQEKAFAFYYEVRDELQRVMPQAPKSLELYLIKTIGCLLNAYAEDFFVLDDKLFRNDYSSMKSESQVYRDLCLKMKLLKIQSLIVEKHFSDADIEQFKLPY